MKKLLAVSFALLVGCAVAVRPPKPAPVARPKPGPTPVTVPTPVPKATPTPDPSLCSADTPDATTYKTDVRWNNNHTVAWIDSTPKTGDTDASRAWCLKNYGADGPWPNPLDLSRCPLRPEGNPAATDCSRKHGLPTWYVLAAAGFVPAPVCVSDSMGCPFQTWVTASDPFHIHVALGDTVKACLAKNPGACSAPVTAQ